MPATVTSTARAVAPSLAADTAARSHTLLRFIACGSVDDGKSTLIGRLLFECNTLADDQLAALQADSARSGATNGEIDYSLLLDGLAAEREQGITIDVAYRYFSTARRSFIVADTPGHEQYTRNMATGASTADLAIILIDARKGILEQTRRHSRIVSMLGVRHVVLAINKMDLVGFDETVFSLIAADYRAFAAGLGFASLVAIPLSAKRGANVGRCASEMPWYGGPTLIEALETADTGAAAEPQEARFVVQWVNRSGTDFRGFSGFVASGHVAPGDAVTLQPSGRIARIARVVTYDGDMPYAVAGQSITLTLDREVDVSRGDVIVSAGAPAIVASRFAVRLLWMSAQPLRAEQPLLVKIGARTVPARIVASSLDVHDLVSGAPQPGQPLGPNAIASAVIATDEPIVAERYQDNRALGGLILIDRLSNETVALGMVLDAASDPGSADTSQVKELATQPVWHDAGAAPVSRTANDNHLRSFAKAVTWRATGSVDTFVLAYLFTGQVKLAAGISLAEIFTKILLYYGHERVWARLKFGTA